MNKKQIFKSDNQVCQIINGEIKEWRMSEDEAFEYNKFQYQNSSSYRESVDLRLKIAELEKTITENTKTISGLVSAIEKYLQTL